MPLLNCGGSQFSTMLELHFADTRSIVPSGIRLNQCHRFRLSSWYLYIPTFDGTLDTTFEVKRTFVPADFTRACPKRLSMNFLPPASRRRFCPPSHASRPSRAKRKATWEETNRI